MSFTRAQVNAAKQALGLDPDLTQAVGIFPTSVYVTHVITSEDGPVVRDGILTTHSETYPIEEATNGDS